MSSQFIVTDQNGRRLRQVLVSHICSPGPPDNCQLSLAQGFDPTFCPNPEDPTLIRNHYTGANGDVALNLPAGPAQGHLFIIRCAGYADVEVRVVPGSSPTIVQMIALPLLGINQVPPEWRPQWQAFREADQELSRWNVGLGANVLQRLRNNLAVAKANLLAALRDPANGIIDPDKYFEDLYWTRDATNQLIPRDWKNVP